MKIYFILLSLFFLPVQVWAVLLSMPAEQVIANNANESLVYVSGQVRKLPASSSGENTSQLSLMTTDFSILGSAPVINESSLLPAVGIEIRFWQAAQPGVFYKTQTDAQGRYVIGLSDGVWMGEACGSDNGFYPAGWQLSIVNKKLLSMQAQTQKNIRLDALSPSNLVEQGSVVTLHGQGFGCSGSLVFSYSNAVDRCGIAQPVTYDRNSIRVNEFISRTDTQLRFQMPALDADREVMKHISTVQYQQSNMLSQGVVIGEKVMPALMDTLCLGQQTMADVPEITFITDENGQLLVDTDVFIDNQSNNSNVQSDASTTAVTPGDIGPELGIIEGVNNGFVPSTGTQLFWGL